MKYPKRGSAKEAKSIQEKKITKQWKFLRMGMKSENGSQTWKLNKWVKVEGELELCKNGLHSSIEPYDAFTYVQGEILAVVECRGEHLKDDNKYCWREQRVIKTYKWTKKDSVKFLGKISREELVKHQLTSQVMAYPSTYDECFCIAAESAARSAAIKKIQVYFKKIIKEKTK